MFQSTRPHGAPRDAVLLAGALGIVSIHAPARGATRVRRGLQEGSRGFNPRARTARDLRTSERLAMRWELQSTLPHEARRSSWRRWDNHGCFNPRARTGRDAARDHAPLPNLVSIHAPARGATPLVPRLLEVLGVSIHAPARGATSKWALDECTCLRFNPRARTGRDSRPRHLFRHSSPFQSTRPHGARHSMAPMVATHARVSIHAPARGATCVICPQEMTWLFQSTRPHGARLQHLPGLCPVSDVSIHAPARGATGLRHQRIDVAGVSIHAPARGATPEADPAPGGNKVSIHAPARGATLFQIKHWSIRHVSIHAPARGATVQPCGAVRLCVRFNPRARTGRDQQAAGLQLPCRSFNPRARTGRDGPASESNLRPEVSIHAPARGATQDGQLFVTINPVSIHAPARGATPITAKQAALRAKFQSTRPHGARPCASIALCVCQSFNPRARTGRDGGPRCMTMTTRCFNPRARTGRDL